MLAKHFKDWCFLTDVSSTAASKCQRVEAETSRCVSAGECWAGRRFAWATGQMFLAICRGEATRSAVCYCGGPG